MFLLRMFQRKWLFATLLVFAGTALCIRLGIWQLDRLEQRRAFNAQFESARAQPPLDLKQTLPEDISEMEWQAVSVTGEYDFENQIALRNQYYGDQYGYHLLTPLRFAGTAVLVDRGWIPAEATPLPRTGGSMTRPGRSRSRGRSGSGRPNPASAASRIRCRKTA